ncbi:MAG: 50S ribosomal protein L25 [Candidatus Tyrphobacter sp.]
MAAKDLTLAVQGREREGTSAARALRSAGRVPLVLYGHGSDPESLSAELRAFEDLLGHGGRTGMITLTDGGRAKDTALVREVQRDPVSRRIIHADLLRVSAHENVRTRVRIVPTGTARGVRDFGGVMDTLLHEVEIEGPVDSLPERIEVDVSELGIHEHVVAGDLPLPASFALVTSSDTVVLAVEPSKTAHQLEEAAAPTLAEEAQPQVIGEEEKKPEAESTP